MWWENMFAAFWVLLQAMLWLCLLVIVGFALVMLISACWMKIKDSREPSRKKLLNTAEAAAVSKYRLKEGHAYINAFVQGADYMWDHLHRRKK